MGDFPFFEEKRTWISIVFVGKANLTGSIGPEDSRGDTQEKARIDPFHAR